jgi:predicted RNase H-like nuclease
LEVHATFSGLLAAYPGAVRVGVDMPIGLPHAGYPKRECEQLARDKLRRRASSVFSPPCRAAANAVSVGEARDLNLQELGSSLSVQAWNICQKIAEVDRALAASPMWAQKVFEVHPEVCFAALAGGQPMAHRKATPEGKQARLALLSQWLPEAAELRDQAMLSFKRSVLQEDDVLDALVVLLTARADAAALRYLPEKSVADEHGLPMRMVYWQPR